MDSQFSSSFTQSFFLDTIRDIHDSRISRDLGYSHWEHLVAPTIPANNGLFLDGLCAIRASLTFLSVIGHRKPPDVTDDTWSIGNNEQQTLAR